MNIEARYRDMLKVVMLIIISWLGVYGISYVCSLVADDYVSNGIVSVLIGFVIFGLVNHTFGQLTKISDNKKLRRRVVYALVIAVLFSVSLIMGYQLRENGMMDPGYMGKLRILARGVCLAIPIFPFTNYLFVGIEKLQFGFLSNEKKSWKNIWVFAVSAVGIFLCWIPVFLAYYPAIMAYDFNRQSIEAAKGFIWFNSYQPLAHTWLIWVALQIGKAVESYEIGIACYSIFQMLIFAVACGYSSVTVYRLSRKKWFVVLMVLFYGLFPFVSVLSVSITKDVLFSALFIVFICLFLERSFLCDSRKQWIMDILWVLEGIVMMLFRNNAIYAVAVFGVAFLAFGWKKQRLRVFVLCMLLVVGGKGALEGMQVVIGTEGRGSKVEMYSIPLQQFSRVGYYHENELDSETYALLDWYITKEFWQKYNPIVADSVKNYVGAYVFDDRWKEQIPEMLQAWVKIGLKYPNEYIDAFLMVNSGYWFWDDITWSEVWGSSVEYRKGALSTDNGSASDALPEGIASESKMPKLEALLQEIVCGNCYYNWPVISALFKPALYCWGILLSFVAATYNRQRKKAIVILLPLIYLATMFLGPVVQMRYVLPIIVILPLMWALLMNGKEENNCNEIET